VNKDLTRRPGGVKSVDTARGECGVTPGRYCADARIDP
jgi:hypothetical protein